MNLSQDVSDLLDRYDNSDIGLDEMIELLRKIGKVRKLTCQTCGEEVPVTDIDEHMRKDHFDSK